MKTASKPTATQASQSQIAFMNWLRLNHPNFLTQLEQDSSLGDVSSVLKSVGASFKNIVSNASGLLDQYVTSKDQLALIKINLARAKQGLPPFNSTADFNASQRMASDAANQKPGLSMQSWLLIGGGGLVLLYLFTRK